MTDFAPDVDRLSFLEREGRVGCRHGNDGAELERMDYLEIIARVTSHIPDKGQVMVRGRVERESAAGVITSSAKRKFLSF